MTTSECVDLLRHQIFEIENSLALYQLLERVCDREGERSFYTKSMRTLLDSIRNKFDMPIALLAVTDEKYEAIRATEFGKLTQAETLADVEIRALSGFDTLFSPRSFLAHLDMYRGECRYLLYVRASDPVEKLKRPTTTVVDHPLLGNPKIRRVIKEHSITLNIDDPTWPIGDPRRINVSKWYLPKLGMAFPAHEETDINSDSFATFLSRSIPRPDSVSPQELMLRAKPAQGTYGCYGHERGMVGNTFLRKLRKGISRRGPYLIQPEHPAPTVLNLADGVEYAYIDRVFLGIGDSPRFLGGFREFLPADSAETKRGRLHGNKNTVFAAINPAQT